MKSICEFLIQEMARRGKNKSKNKRDKGFVRQAKRAKIKEEQRKERWAAEIERKNPKNDQINEPKNEKAETKFEQFENFEDPPEVLTQLPPYKPCFPTDHPQAPRTKNGKLGQILSNSYDQDLTTHRDRLNRKLTPSFKKSFDFYMFNAPSSRIPSKKIPKIGKISKK